MTTLNSILTTYSQLLVDSSFAPQIYSTTDLLLSPAHVRALVPDSSLQNLQDAVIDSGVQVVLTNTYDMSRFKLAWLDCADRCSELNKRAAQMTRQALGRHRKHVAIAGNIGAANARVPYADMVNAYAEQAEALAAGGVDCLWLEGFKSPVELEAALAGCAIGSADIPIIATVALTQQPDLMTMLHLLDRTLQVASLGIDATYGLADFGHALAEINTSKPVAIKGNLNVLTTEYGLTLSVTELWQRFAQQVSMNGVRIIAGDEMCNMADLCAMSNELKKAGFVRSFAPTHA